MSVKPILRIGHPLLLKCCDPVDQFATPQLDGLINDLFDTMVSADGAGLAAPQIGVNLRVVVFEVSSNPRYPDVDEVPKTVLINPTISALDDEMKDSWEGCLSVPAMRGLVPRYNSIRYSGFDAQGVLFEREVSGFHARVVQHECDHLDGVLYPQRIVDMRDFGYDEELFPPEQEQQ